MRYLVTVILLFLGTSAANAWDLFGESTFKNKLFIYSASPSTIKKAACLSSENQNRSSVSQKLKSLSYGDQIADYTMIYGLIIENESQILVTALQSLLRGATGLANVNCDKAECAVKAIFGVNKGPRMLYLMARYGVNTSHYARNAYISRSLPASPWTTTELDLITATLGDLPESMFPLKDNVNLSYRNQDDKLSAHGDTHGLTSDDDHSVVLFPSWRAMNKYQQKAVLLHELAHVIDYKLGLSQSGVWLRFSGWKFGKKGKDEYEKYDQFVSKYSYSSSYEDFAEAVTAYRYNYKLLKEISPAKYQFIKEVVFGGIEFVDEESCDISQSYFEVEVNPSENPFEYASCSQAFEFYAVIGKAKGELDDCVYSEALNQIMSHKGNIPAQAKYTSLIHRHRESYNYPRVTYAEFYKEDILDLVDSLVEAYKVFP